MTVYLPAIVHYCHVCKERKFAGVKEWSMHMAECHVDDLIGLSLGHYDCLLCRRRFSSHPFKSLDKMIVFAHLLGFHQLELSYTKYQQMVYVTFNAPSDKAQISMEGQ